MTNGGGCLVGNFIKVFTRAHRALLSTLKHLSIIEHSVALLSTYQHSWSLTNTLEKVNLTLSPMAYHVLWHPPRYQWRNHFWHHVAKAYLLIDTFSGHMQKFRPISQKWHEISDFRNFVRLRFLITLINENSHNWVDFQDKELIFYMQPWF